MSDRTVSRRCSSLPLALACPASQTPPALKVERDDAAARLGTAVHAWLAGMIRGRPEPTDHYALAERVVPAELAPLCWSAWRCWEAAAAHFPHPNVECELDAEWSAGDGQTIRLTGHADVLSVVGDEVRIGDWKSGRVDQDSTEQLRGYCWLSLQYFTDATQARACVVRVRDGTAEWYPAWTRAELAAWWAGAWPQLQETETYRPGAHCGGCKRAHECPARWLQVREAAYILLNGENLHLTPPAECAGAVYGSLYTLAKRVERVCEDIREQVRAEVELAGGTLPTGDGRELTLVPQVKREIDYDPAAPVLLETLGLDRLTTLIRVNKSDVEDAVRALAPKGGKGAAVQELHRRLDEAGALTTRTTWRLECRRSVPRIEEGNGHADAAAPTGAADTDAI